MIKTIFEKDISIILERHVNLVISKQILYTTFIKGLKGTRKLKKKI